MYPTQRNVSDKYTKDPVIITDMPQMAQFVYEIYMKKLETASKEEVEKVKVVLSVMKCRIITFCIALKIRSKNFTEYTRRYCPSDQSAGGGSRRSHSYTI